MLSVRALRHLLRPICLRKWDVTLQENETDGGMLADKEQIKKLAEEGIFLHYDSIKRVFED